MRGMAPRTCLHCGERIGLGGARGRLPKFCSDRCRVASHREEVVPKVMRQSNRWLTYQWPDKAPRQVDGRLASVTDPSTWTTYSNVRRLPRGYVLGEGIGCIDFDHCVDDAGNLHPTVAAIVEPLRTKTYIEVSPSGDGLHVFGLIAPDRGWKRPLGDGMSIEVYSQDRYVTVTGKRWSKDSRLGHVRRHVAHLAPFAA